ncbi:MAG TPA: glycosyltransferase family 39 protein [Nitrospirota bacterium]|nr:glycosyltransferase family 39 protein [Nitrospirota bacterium]
MLETNVKSTTIALSEGTRIEYRYLLAFSIALGCFLRLYRIGSQPLWLDEAFSHWFSGRTIAELWTVVPRFETTPPLYYTALKLWKSVAGSSEAGLRSLSAVMSIGCIPLVFLLGRFLGKSAGGEWIGAMAALLLAVAPVQIQYAQEVRQYAMLTFGVTLTLCSLLWIMRHPVEACRPLFGRSSGPGNSSAATPAWALLVIAASFTLWLHNTAVLFVFTLFLAVLAWFFTELRLNKVFLGNLAIAGAATLLLWIPYLVFLIPQAKNASLPIPAPTLQSTFDTVVLLLLGHPVAGTTSPSDVLKIAVLVLLILLAAGGLVHIKRHAGLSVSLLILGAIIGPILLELVISLLFRPILLTRTLIYVSVPFLFAVAAGIVMVLQKPQKRAFAMVLLALLFLKWDVTYYRAEEKAGKEPWDRIAQAVAGKAHDSVALLVPNNIAIPFSYYADRVAGGGLNIVPLPFPLSDFLHAELNPERLGTDSLKAIQMRASDIPAIDGLIAGRSPVWLITRREDLFDRQALVTNALVHKRVLVSKKEFGEISVYQFR